MKYLKLTSAVVVFTLCLMGYKTTNNNINVVEKDTTSKDVTVNNSLNLNKPIPKDNTVRKGVLENGMTFYLQATDVKKDVVSYYIIQNVVSILENDD